MAVALPEKQTLAPTTGRIGVSLNGLLGVVQAEPVGAQSTAQGGEGTTRAVGRVGQEPRRPPPRVTAEEKVAAAGWGDP